MRRGRDVIATGMPGRPRAHARWALLAVLALVIGVAGCGTDSDGAASDGETTTTEEVTDTGGQADSGDGMEAAEVDVMLTDEGVEGLPDDLSAGLVSVTVDDQTTDGGTGDEVDFTRVADGTTVDEFLTGISSVLAGGPFPEFMENTSGAVGESTVVLGEGSYIVWANTASGSDVEPTADDLIASELTVGAGDDEAMLPEADGSVTTTDYQFDIDIPAGEATINMRNDSEEQFHHVIVADFGTNDPEVVEENIAALLSSEDGAPPEGIDGEQIDFDAAGSAVYGPGSSGTFQTDLVEGNTYVALCFIQDVSGGAPHAIEHDMHEVFVA